MHIFWLFGINTCGILAHYKFSVWASRLCNLVRIHSVLFQCSWWPFVLFIYSASMSTSENMGDPGDDILLNSDPDDEDILDGCLRGKDENRWRNHVNDLCWYKAPVISNTQHIKNAQWVGKKTVVEGKRWCKTAKHKSKNWQPCFSQKAQQRRLELRDQVTYRWQQGCSNSLTESCRRGRRNWEWRWRWDFKRITEGVQVWRLVWG